MNMKIVAIHLPMVWFVFQARALSVWGNCLRGPDSPHYVCEHEEHHHLRAAEKDGGGSASATAAVKVDLLPPVINDRVASDAKVFPEKITKRTLEDKKILFSTNADFDLGRLINLNHNAVQDQLQLDQDPQPFNFIWVACSTRGTIVKVDTLSRKILGEYQTAPTNNGKLNKPGKLGDPSRTTVDKDGSVWVANRNDIGPNEYGTIVHIGLVENNQCEDRNGDGIIQTSTGLGDIKIWTDGSGARSVSTAEDECIIHYTEVKSQGTRHISIDSDNNLWVGGAKLRNFDKVKGGGWRVPDSGSIMQSYPAVGYGGYGGLIDPQGFLWSSGKYLSTELNNLLRWDTSKPLEAGANKNGDPVGKHIGPIKPGYNWAGQKALGSYGLCIDSQGNVWVTELGSNVHKYSPEGRWIKSKSNGSTRAQGCAVDKKNDHVWVAHSDSGSTVGHLDNDGNLVGIVKVGSDPAKVSGPTGVAVDGAGKIWVTNTKDHSISVIDPSEENGIGKQVDIISLKDGCYPYNYGSMTGSDNITPGPNTGTWTVEYDHGSVPDNWGRIEWNAELPGDSSLSVQVKNKEGDPWKQVENGQSLSDLNGQHLYIQVSFVRGFVGGISPILKDLSINFQSTPPTTPPPTPSPPGGKAEVWVGHHQFQSHMEKFDQAKIWVISSNSNHHSSLPAGTWKPLPKNMKGLDSYQGDKKFAKFYSIGAGEESTNLVAAINRPVDVSKALHLPVFVMEIEDPAAFKERVDKANQKMNDNFSNTLLRYQVLPWMDWYTRGYGWVEFNSNGYISGLLSYLDHVIEIPADNNMYGWDKPVPVAFFDKDFRTDKEVKDEIFKPPMEGEAEIWFGYHSVFTSGEEDVWVDHAKLWVISSNPAHHVAIGVAWHDLRQDRIPIGYKGDKNFAKFFTLGAGFSAPELKPEVNYPDDVNINLSGAHMVTSGIDPASFMTTIKTANKNMEDCFEVSDLKRETAFPRDWNDWAWGWNEFNGNGYISGLLSFLDYNVKIPEGAILPGWKKAVPKGIFESSCSSNLEAQLLIFNEHPAPNCNEYSDLVAELEAAKVLVGNESEASQVPKLDLPAPPVKTEQSALTSDPLF